MTIKIIKEKITKEDLEKIAQETYGDMVKAAVDVKREILAVGGEFHSDAEAVLIDDGSRATDVWGINIRINKPKSERIEFSALINVKPLSDNRSMEIQDDEIKEKIRTILASLVEP